MDKGRVLRNVYKKKLAEYVQEKEQKGEQETHSETVPKVKNAIKVVPRKAFKVNLKKVDDQGRVLAILPVDINAVLSTGEKKKLLVTIKAIENAGKTNSTDVLVQRMDNLLKKILREVGGYSLDYMASLKKILEETTKNDNRINDLFPIFTNSPINRAKFKNFVNQIIELLDEKTEETRGELEVEENILPSVEEKGQEDLDVKLQTIGFGLPQEDGGMRKGRHNTKRGYIGYGKEKKVKVRAKLIKRKTPSEHVIFSTTPAIDKGFAANPSAANSPLGKKAFMAPQSNAIPKYLNFNSIPNKRGSFAVLE